MTDDSVLVVVKLKDVQLARSNKGAKITPKFTILFELVHEVTVIFPFVSERSLQLARGVYSCCNRSLQFVAHKWLKEQTCIFRL